MKHESKNGNVSRKSWTGRLLSSIKRAGGQELSDMSPQQEQFAVNLGGAYTNEVNHLRAPMNRVIIALSALLGIASLVLTAITNPHLGLNLFSLDEALLVVSIGHAMRALGEGALLWCLTRAMRHAPYSYKRLFLLTLVLCVAFHLSTSVCYFFSYYSLTTVLAILAILSLLAELYLFFSIFGTYDGILSFLAIAALSMLVLNGLSSIVSHGIWLIIIILLSRLAGTLYFLLYIRLLDNKSNSTGQAATI